MTDEIQENAKTGVGFVFGLLVGSLIGAATAILVAPQSGNQTREYLKRKAGEAKDRAELYASEIKDDLGEWTEKTKGTVTEKMQEARGRMAEKLNEARGKVAEKVQQVLHRSEKENGKPEQVKSN